MGMYAEATISCLTIPLCQILTIVHTCMTAQERQEKHSVSWKDLLDSQHYKPKIFWDKKYMPAWPLYQYFTSILFINIF